MDTVRVEVHLYSILRKYAQEKGYSDSRFTVEVPRGTTVDEIREMLGIPERWIGRFLKEANRLPADYAVQEGDVIDILPPTIGGGH